MAGTSCQAGTIFHLVITVTTGPSTLTLAKKDRTQRLTSDFKASMALVILSASDSILRLEKDLLPTMVSRRTLVR